MGIWLSPGIYLRVNLDHEWLQCHMEHFSLYADEIVDLSVPPQHPPPPGSLLYLPLLPIPACHKAQYYPINNSLLRFYNNIYALIWANSRYHCYQNDIAP